ncbi:MAG: hypothetical protein QJT81_05090 [Candidatus Thiothrix putei]|uniref:TIR domain-containing protein n=1 Tax=Candidatus Thiothrix putei TaxID=3080811 RepID=A0AA95HIU3_9GAMM|nr:MAG: hypothetical protein QJT81_05090 [Candidatus Thiothrix putei]
MPKAFISYARDGSYGENLAAEIQQQLQAAGFAVFSEFKIAGRAAATLVVYSR